MSPEDSNPERDRKKKPYVKPEIRQVPLRPEEAVLGNCKTNGIAGPAFADCGIVACSSMGS